MLSPKRFEKISDTNAFLHDALDQLGKYGDNITDFNKDEETFTTNMKALVAKLNALHGNQIFEKRINHIMTMVHCYEPITQAYPSSISDKNFIAYADFLSHNQISNNTNKINVVSTHPTITFPPKANVFNPVVLIFRYYRSNTNDKSYQFASLCAKSVLSMFGQYTIQSGNKSILMPTNSIWTILIVDDTFIDFQITDLVFNFYIDATEKMEYDDEEIKADAEAQTNFIIVTEAKNDRVIKDDQDVNSHITLDTATKIRLEVNTKSCDLSEVCDASSNQSININNDFMINLVLIILQYTDHHHKSLSYTMVDGLNDSNLKNSVTEVNNILSWLNKKVGGDDIVSSFFNNETIGLTIGVVGAAVLAAARVSATKNYYGIPSGVFFELFLLLKEGVKQSFSLYGVCISCTGLIASAIKKKQANKSMTSAEYFYEFFRGMMFNVIVQIASLGTFFNVSDTNRSSSNMMNFGSARGKFQKRNERSFQIARELLYNEKRRAVQVEGTWEYKIMYNLLRAAGSVLVKYPSQYLVGPLGYHAYSYIKNELGQMSIANIVTTQSLDNSSSFFRGDISPTQKLVSVGSTHVLIYKLSDNGKSGYEQIRK